MQLRVSSVLGNPVDCCFETVLGVRHANQASRKFDPIVHGRSAIRDGGSMPKTQRFVKVSLQKSLTSCILHMFFGKENGQTRFVVGNSRIHVAVLNLSCR